MRCGRGHATPIQPPMAARVYRRNSDVTNKLVRQLAATWGVGGGVPRPQQIQILWAHLYGFPLTSMEMTCITRHNPWTGAALEESSHVFLVLDNNVRVRFHGAVEATAPDPGTNQHRSLPVTSLFHQRSCALIGARVGSVA